MSVDSNSRTMKSSIEKWISWKRIFVPFSFSTLYQPTSSEVLDLAVTAPDIGFLRPVESHVEAC
jgi:hypothetical protein